MATPQPAPSWQMLPAAAAGAVIAGGFVAVLSSSGLGVALPLSAVCSGAVLWSTTRRARALLPADGRRAFVYALGASALVAFLWPWLIAVHVRPAWVESTYNFRDHNELPGWALATTMLSMFGFAFLVALTEGVASLLHRPLRVVTRALVAPLAVAVAALSVVALARAASHPAPASRSRRAR